MNVQGWDFSLSKNEFVEEKSGITLISGKFMYAFECFQEISVEKKEKWKKNKKVEQSKRLGSMWANR
jgi:hypothetical protein